MKEIYTDLTVPELEGRIIYAKKKSGWRIKLEHFIKTRRVCITPFLPSVLLNPKKDLT